MIVTATGVYGDTEDSFFAKLLREGVTFFVDVRQRRGMRGSKYAFANSTYLQSKLDGLGIKYMHIKELAPTNEIRDAQKQHDLMVGHGKRERKCLGEKFVELYKKDVLDGFNFKGFLEVNSLEKIVFFCVEQECLACHRLLIVNKLKEEFQLDGYCF